MTQHLGDLSTPSEKGWTKERNLVSWNGGAPKYDIRDWSEDHTKMGKGVTLTAEQAKKH
ncbi:MAG: PC4/YdbC family ssDNA-binding protein [Lachnospiraceae bacterium]|nr:PC4/YdbC family ssDNA-binding protein [Lachnospiraceae bacterium]